MRTNLIKTKELPKVVEPSTTDGMLDMVIAFDTTGSMSAYINAVKTHVKELVPKLFSSNPDLRIGIVAFGDYCDMKSKDNFGKAYQVLDLLKSRTMKINIKEIAVGDVFSEESHYIVEEIGKDTIKFKIEGEDRVLRGYKMQFVSRDGKYKCLDMDIERNSKEDGVRLVNINTIKQLIFNGVKYVVE